jgi:hypothetical protein
LYDTEMLIEYRISQQVTYDSLKFN